MWTRPIGRVISTESAGLQCDILSRRQSPPRPGSQRTICQCLPDLRKTRRSMQMIQLRDLQPMIEPAAVDGAALSPLWGLPFAGMLLSIALLPLLTPAFWHHHFGKIALYTVAGGLCIRGNLHGSPVMNTGLLALGTLLASVMGTTGAAMLLIRPLLRANDNRRHTVHVVIFFIFLVANIGGALTPLGDPPLFLGFLNGVGFFWTTAHLFKPMLFAVILLLALFYLIDVYYFHHREEARAPFLDPTPDSPSFSIEGKINFVWLACVLALVLMSGLWKPGIAFHLWGAQVDMQNLARELLLLGVMAASWWTTPRSARAANDFNWAPVAEVAKLFAGIFITIAPVIAMLRAGSAGAFAFVGRAISDVNGQPVGAMVFWVTGLLSSFLDNAPTYLVFFNTLGGNAQTLMNEGATALAALSAGAVFMGANTYIGNGPNFMVKAIAQSRGVRMPSFFGFMAWSGCVLMPVFALTTWIFFRYAFRTAALAVLRLLAVLGVLSASARLASTAVRNSSFHCEPSHASFPVDHRSCCAGVDRAGAVRAFYAPGTRIA